MFEPQFRAGVSFLNHLFMQNIHVWFIKIEFQVSFSSMECRVGGWVAIFAAHDMLDPHIEDEPQNEEQHAPYSKY